jgi:hypothetical protein
MVAGRDYRSVRVFFTSLLVLSAAWTAAAPRGQTSNNGSVSGRVTLTKRIRGTALPTATCRAPSRSVPPATPEIHNVVVYLRDPAFRGTPAPRRAEMRQTGETFQPHVRIPRGSTVDFERRPALSQRLLAFGRGQLQSRSVPALKRAARRSPSRES